MPPLKFLTIILMTSFMFLQAWALGKSDVASLILMGIASFIMYHAVITLQVGHKKTLRVHAKENSWLHRFLSDENTIWLKIISLFSSIFLAMLLTVTLKGIILNHGYIILFLIILASSFALFSLFHSKNNSNTMIEKNLQQDVATHANNLLYFLLFPCF